MNLILKLIALFLLTVSLNAAYAETLWKLGIGVGNVTTHAYPGSGETISITSPIPYLQVKTDWFDLDREGLHTNFFQNTNFRLDISFDFGAPVKSDENQLRTGMPDLEPVGQVGPVLIYQLVDSDDLKWQLQLPVTYAYAFDNLDMHSIGWSSNPRIYYNYLYGTKKLPLDISVSLGPVYGSSELHQYYYDVNNDYMTTERDAYASVAGLAGYRLNASITRRMNGYWLGVYLRYQNLSAAVFADSPLVEQNDYWFVAIGASWLFAGNM